MKTCRRLQLSANQINALKLRRHENTTPQMVRF